MDCVPEDFYGYSKAAAEELILLFSRRYYLPLTIFRAALIYGPSQGGTMFIPSLVRSLLKGELFRMTAGEQTRDFLYIDDFVSALLLACSSGLSGVYNVGTGNALSMRSAALIAEQVTGREGLIELGALPYRVNESWQYCLSPEKLVREAGWIPRVGLREGLERIVQYEHQLMTES